MLILLDPTGQVEVEPPARLEEGLKRLEALESMQGRKQQRRLDPPSLLPQEFLKPLFGCCQKNVVSPLRFLLKGRQRERSNLDQLTVVFLVPCA